MNAALHIHSLPQPRIQALAARIEGQIVHVSALTPGTVDNVLVADNECVDKGALLIELNQAKRDRRISAAAAELDSAMLATLEPSQPIDVVQKMVLARVSMHLSPEVKRARAAYLQARLNALNAE